jgi:hypothetical protein
VTDRLNRLYVLDGHEVREATLMEWARFFDNLDARTVAKTEVAAGVRVSTVFLGLDHNFSGRGPPVLFETLVFSDYGGDDGRRYCTWAEAELGHMEIVEAITARLEGASATQGG